MTPENKAQLEKSLLRAYNEAENEVEKDTLYWIAYDLGIKLPKPDDEETKRIVTNIHKSLKNFLL